MVSPEVEVAARAIYPDAGTLRLHPVPEKLFHPEPDRPGLNRFDDPNGVHAVDDAELEWEPDDADDRLSRGLQLDLSL